MHPVCAQCGGPVRPTTVAWLQRATSVYPVPNTKPQLHDFDAGEHTCTGQGQHQPSVQVNEPAPNAGRYSAEQVRDRIQETHKTCQALCSNVFDNFLPFSWVRFIGTIGTHLMICSDIPRAGVGTQDLKSFGAHEVDHFSLYGPWNYTVFKGSVDDKTTAPFWNYKYSTTSISWRAFATFLNVSEFPDCYLYKTECDQPPIGPLGPISRLNASSVFPLIDAVAEAVKEYKQKTSNQTSSRPRQPSEVVLRTQTRFFDRLHHYILPQLFVRPVWRTHQALHYPHELLFSKAMNHSSMPEDVPVRVHSTAICYHTSGVRPFFCDDIWINYSRSCLANNPNNDTSPQVGLIWVDTFRRLMQLQLQFPDKRVDLTLLSSHEDVQQNVGGFAYMSRRKVDVATVIRVRDCNRGANDGDNAVCKTVYVDDSRYENAVFASNVVEWYYIVALLRFVAQGYFYWRILLLLYGCYCTRAGEHRYCSRSPLIKLQATLKMFICIPSPSLVYGSPVPVVCYTLAHLIDAPFAYELIAQHFSEPMGQYHFDAPVFFRLALTQMCNVWLLALGVQIFLYFFIVNRNNWSPGKGVIAFPEFSLAVFACLTILTQLRSLSFRDSRILSLIPLPAHAARPGARYKFVPEHHGSGNMLMEGVILDLKYFSLLIVIAALLLGLLHIWLETTGHYKHRHHEQASLLIARSAVPYSAGSLWPAAAVSISWTNDVISDQLPNARPRSMTGKFMSRRQRARVRVSVEVAKLQKSMTEWPTTPKQQTKFLLQQMEHIHKRREQVDTITVLLNIVNMTDPWTYFRLRYLRRDIVCYFECVATRRIFMLPMSVARNVRDIDLPWHDFVCLGTAFTCDLPWTVLIQCG